MKVLSPFHLTKEESEEYIQEFSLQVDQMEVSDSTLVEYVQSYFDVYRETVEEFFPALAPFIPLYSNYPYHTMIVRQGKNGVIIGHRPCSGRVIEVVRPNELDPPLESLNLLDIGKQLELPFLQFDCRVRSYNINEAAEEACGDALRTALEYFWTLIRGSDFERLCSELTRAEGISPEALEIRGDVGLDFIGQVLIQEPAGFRRFERWAFEFKHHVEDRVSARLLRHVEGLVKEVGPRLDVVCLVTSGDLTSVGNHIAVNNPRVRVWDRPILNRLAHEHLEVLETYFVEYANAVREFSKPPVLVQTNRYEEFIARLNECKPGHEHFSLYEDIGTEIWHYLFSSALGAPKKQRSTRDGVQRRDVLFRNQRSSRFWQRVAERFNADFIIVDFKNYEDPVGSEVVKDVEEYASDILGRFIVVVSRLGGDDTVEPAQLRYLTNRSTAILVVSDEQMLEMIRRREQNESPEDLLEDMLDELILKA